MSNVKLSNPRSKQLIWCCTQGCSKAIQAPRRVHEGPACREPLGVAEAAGCSCRGALGPEPARQRGLHGLPQAQARGMVQRNPKTRPQAFRGRRGRARARLRGPGGGNRGRRSLWWRRRLWVCTQLVLCINQNLTSGERRTGTAQCPGCIAPFLEADRNRKALITPENVTAVDCELYHGDCVEEE
jgi:hypothetical protein